MAFFCWPRLAKIQRLTPENPVEVDEHQERLPDGKTAWLRWVDRGIFDAQGQLVEVQGVGIDITERREAEEQLRQSETQLQHVIDTVPEGVLLVEDEPATRQAIVDSLLMLNYKLVEAKNGREAIAILKTQAGQIAVVLSDVIMPDMGGIALLHAIRQQQFTMPVILMSGHPFHGEVESLKGLGLFSKLLGKNARKTVAL